MEKVPLQDILESIRRELENLKSTESESSVYADVAIAGLGSTMNLIRCIHTALATGADPRRVRQFINKHLRRTMAADAGAVQELAGVPDEPLLTDCGAAFVLTHREPDENPSQPGASTRVRTRPAPASRCAGEPAQPDGVRATISVKVPPRPSLAIFWPDFTCQKKCSTPSKAIK